VVLAAAGIWRDWQSVVAAMNSVPQGGPRLKQQSPAGGGPAGLISLAD
jgi:hypothetical protein